VKESEGQMYRTIVSGWVPIPLAERLERIARERNVSRSSLIGDVLSMFADGKPIQPMPRRLGNRDGKEEQSLQIIREHAGESCTKLVRRLADAGIKRGVNWIARKRLPMRAKGSTLTEE
jgi:hypothetical protein